MFRSDRGFFDCFKENKRAVLIIMLLVPLLLMLAIVPQRAETEYESPTEEGRLSEIVSKVSGVGRCEVMINYDDGGEVFGVIILCEGAESVTVRERLSDLLSSLYGIGQNRISILKIRE